MAMERKLELLSPAGDWERLEMAVAYGADAVYLAGDTFGMRSFAGNFSPEELRRAADLCRRRGVALHVTCNTMPPKPGGGPAAPVAGVAGGLRRHRRDPG